jgi:uncharacterized alkaline shock family protein YloU
VGAAAVDGEGWYKAAVTDGHASISADIVARYAGDAAQDVAGVRGLVESHIPRHRGVRVSEEDGRVVRLELHVAVEWGAPIPDVARAVQRHVREYLGQMADLELEAVDVVVDEIGPRGES